MSENIAGNRPVLFVFAVAAALALAPRPAMAIDEIQVYNAEIAEPGQWTLQQHLNYVASGVQQPDHPGGLISDHSLNGTPELAYGVAPWWELGFYAPFAYDEFGNFNAQGVKLRTLFVSPEAETRDFFYGANFEFSYNSAVFSPTRFGVELRPIIGWRSPDLEFIVNPIVDFAVGHYGATTLAPAVRLAHKFTKDFDLGFEYYSDLGQIGHSTALKDQQHTLFAVTDFKIGDFDVNFGVGRGFTPSSDRLVFKAILGYAFPAPKNAEGTPHWLQKIF